MNQERALAPAAAPLGNLAVLLAGFAALYATTVRDMAADWYLDDNYSHGFLIPVISGYLLWQMRSEIRETELRPSWAGLPLFVAGLLMFLFGQLAGEAFTMRCSLLVVGAGVLLFCGGTPLFKTVRFPFCYLFYMVPLPYLLYDAVAFPLKLFVSRASVLALNLIGVPALREGNVISLVNTTLEVADACSGIRSLVSLFALATALAYVSQKGLLRQSVLVLLALPIAIFANGVRVIGTGILASRFGAEAAQGFFHEFAGMVIFGVAMALLILSSAVLAKIGSKRHE